MLFCVMPYEEQATKWAPYLRERYFDMLAKCSRIECIDLHAQSRTQFLAYQRIIDQSDIALTVFDAEISLDERDENQALFYAIRKENPVLNLNPYTLKVQLHHNHSTEL